MAQVNIRIDDTLKRQGEELFHALGLTFSAAVSVFISKAVSERGLPFPVTLNDPFYSESNMKALRESIAEFDDPTIPKIVKTMEELEAMANE
ncbi:MAG: type II toxin-antitoxin system RelB/DinJ family antitoxin [Oscillospiraceae bacterium]|nr:type II toxin-antitoxin system RelB/DinJ family antitoxin [Oscillospiraceae bacterium]